jgi:ACDE family multidrug resistance protein
VLFNRPNDLQHIVRDDVGGELSRLGGLEGFARSSIATVLPLAVLDSLGSSQAVSNVYFVGACFALLFTLNVGRFERLLPRRWLLTLAMSGSVIGGLIAALSHGPLIAIAVALVTIEASTFTVLLALFIMDYIGRRELARNESRRLVYSGIGWIVGPALAYTLYSGVGRWAPFVVSMVAMTTALGYFWKLRLGPNPALATPKTPAPSPFRSIPRFFHQRYLRIAFAITLMRSIYWVSFFIYAPIYAIECGLPRKSVGFLVSVVAVLLLASPIIQRVAQRFSNRSMIVAGLILVGLSLASLAEIGEPETIGLAFWVLGTMGAVVLDVVGNLPFMRTVKPRERPEMTSVFSSARDASSLIAPGLGALVLWLGPFELYFLLLAGLSLAVAMLATKLPRRI